jgi:hypothetical protein
LTDALLSIKTSSLKCIGTIRKPNNLFSKCLGSL